MDKLSEIQARIEARQAEIDELANLDVITPEQDARLGELVTENRADIAERDRIVARNREIEEVRAAATRYEPGAAPQVLKRVEGYDTADLRSLRGGELRDRALKVLDDRDVTHHLTDADMSKVYDLTRQLGEKHNQHLIATMRPEYRSAFGKRMAGREWDLTDGEKRALDEVRAWSVGSDSTVIPELFDPTVIMSNAGAINPIRSISRILTGTADMWEGLYSAGVTASWDQEAAEVSDDDPAFTRPTITAHKAAAFVPFSVEFQGDWEQLGAEVVRMFADAKNRLESDAFANGTGSNQPTGYVYSLNANTYAETTPTTDGAFGVEDLYKTMNALPRRWRPGATWVVSLDVANEIRAFGTAVAHTYTVDLTEGYNFRLLGLPMVEHSAAPTRTGTTGAENILVLGDFGQFGIYDRIGMSVELVPHLFSTGNGRPTGSRGYYAFWRVGSDWIVKGTTPPGVLLQNQ